MIWPLSLKQPERDWIPWPCGLWADRWRKRPRQFTKACMFACTFHEVQTFNLSEWFYADSTLEETVPSILNPWQFKDWLMIELFGLSCAATKRWSRQEGALHQRWTHKLTFRLVEFLLHSWRSLLCRHSLFRHFNYQSAQRFKTKPARNNWLWRDSLSYKAFSYCRLMQTNSD